MHLKMNALHCLNQLSHLEIISNVSYLRFPKLIKRAKNVRKYYY